MLEFSGKFSLIDFSSWGRDETLFGMLINRESCGRGKIYR